MNQPGDRFEQEADRMAETIMRGGIAGRNAISSLGQGGGAVQREEPKTPPKPDNYDEAISKILDALKETPVAKQLQAKAAEMGKDFAASVEGKVIIGSSLGGALAAIIATNSKLPMQIPELPLDFIAPGLKAKITWEGPVQQPTNAGLVLTTKSGVSFGASYTKTPASGSKPEEQKAGLSLTIPLGGSSEKKKGGPTASEKYRTETARIAAGQEQFRAGMKTPGKKNDDKDFVDSYVRSKVDPTNPLGLPPLKKKEDLLLMRKAPNESSVAPATAPSIVDEVLQSSGEPLEGATRALMEERFGYDFGNVRIHRDGRAAESARAVHAEAYTVGRDIVFNSGGFAPRTEMGRRLLAHELTHVVQQSTGSAKATQLQRKSAPAPANPTLEESDKSWIKAFGLRKWLKGIISDWQDIQARYEAATAATFHPTEALLMGILTASRSRIDLGEEQIKTELSGDPALLKEFRDAYRKMISVVVPKFASLTGKNATDVFQAHRREIPEWAIPAAPETGPDAQDATAIPGLERAFCETKRTGFEFCGLVIRTARDAFRVTKAGTSRSATDCPAQATPASGESVVAYYHSHPPSQVRVAGKDANLDFSEAGHGRTVGDRDESEDRGWDWYLINHEGLMKRYIPSRDERRRGVTRELGTTSVTCR